MAITGTSGQPVQIDSLQNQAGGAVQQKEGKFRGRSVTQSPNNDSHLQGMEKNKSPIKKMLTRLMNVALGVKQQVSRPDPALKEAKAEKQQLSHTDPSMKAIEAKINSKKSSQESVLAALQEHAKTPAKLQDILASLPHEAAEKPHVQQALREHGVQLLAAQAHSHQEIAGGIQKLFDPGQPLRESVQQNLGDLNAKYEELILSQFSRSINNQLQNSPDLASCLVGELPTSDVSVSPTALRATNRSQIVLAAQVFEQAREMHNQLSQLLKQDNLPDETIKTIESALTETRSTIQKTASEIPSLERQHMIFNGEHFLSDRYKQSINERSNPAPVKSPKQSKQVVESATQQASQQVASPKSSRKAPPIPAHQQHIQQLKNEHFLLANDLKTLGSLMNTLAKNGTPDDQLIYLADRYPDYHWNDWSLNQYMELCQEACDAMRNNQATDIDTALRQAAVRKSQQ